MLRHLVAVRATTIHSTNMISLRRSSDPSIVRRLQRAIEGLLEPAVRANTEVHRGRPARRRMVAGNATTYFCPRFRWVLSAARATSQKSFVHVVHLESRRRGARVSPSHALCAPPGERVP